MGRQDSEDDEIICDHDEQVQAPLQPQQQRPELRRSTRNRVQTDHYGHPISSLLKGERKKITIVVIVTYTHISY